MLVLYLIDCCVCQYYKRPQCHDLELPIAMLAKIKPPAATIDSPALSAAATLSSGVHIIKTNEQNTKPNPPLIRIVKTSWRLRHPSKGALLPHVGEDMANATAFIAPFQRTMSRQPRRRGKDGEKGDRR
jgi:hypothetical protein